MVTGTSVEEGLWGASAHGIQQHRPLTSQWQILACRIALATWTVSRGSCQRAEAPGWASARPCGCATVGPCWGSRDAGGDVAGSHGPRQVCLIVEPELLLHRRCNEPLLSWAPSAFRLSPPGF